MYGYSKYHKLTVIRKKSATSVNYYSDVPDVVKWDCIPITQKIRRFISLEQSCRVKRGV